MKQKSNRPRSVSGFTLVELLVVIVIIAALAAVAFSVGPKMMKRGNATKSVQNIRQIGSLFSVYAAENNSNLPPIKKAAAKDGSTPKVDWYEGLLSFAYPEVPLLTFSSKPWWESAKPMMRNPLLPASRFQPWYNGYAMNSMLSENTAQARSGGAWGDGDGPEGQGVPLARISDPARTPLASTNRNWFYRASDLTALTKDSSLDKALVVDGKVPVLFVDGHVETMTPADYSARKLNKMPEK